MVVHDPQPAAVRSLASSDDRAKWIWRCHIDSSTPDQAASDFLRPYIERYDCAVFTLPEFVPPGLSVPTAFIAPAIDPLSSKNRELPAFLARETVAELGIDLSPPVDDPGLALRPLEGPARRGRGLAARALRVPGAPARPRRLDGRRRSGGVAHLRGARGRGAQRARLLPAHEPDGRDRSRGERVAARHRRRRAEEHPRGVQPPQKHTPPRRRGNSNHQEPRGGRRATVAIKFCPPREPSSRAPTAEGGRRGGRRGGGEKFFLRGAC